MLHKAKEILKKYWGYSAFREGQEHLIQQLLNGHDTLGIMPTGGGKSICYQVPALLLEGVTVVVSPLISLMKDQVDALEKMGVPATYINSTLTHKEEDNRIQACINGEIKLVYVAPERLNAPSFRHLLNELPISLVAIDEAHCISQWGHDFRPSYLSIKNVLEELQPKPIVTALTATATPEVREDICSILNIKNDHIIMTGFARENLAFSVTKGQEKRKFLIQYLKENETESGIIYASTRKEVDQVHNFLKKSGYNVGKYHAGLSEQERSESQDRFLFDKDTIIVATNAFGMGIDKSNVRFVIHYNLPKNMESYYQEAGRAGRDAEESECLLLFSPQDVQVQKFLIEQTQLDEERKQNEYSKLQDMVNFCHTENCLQVYILEYFGQTEGLQPCGKCANCKDQREKVDVTKEAQMIFSCVKRMNERFGKTLVAQVLKGSNNKRVREMNLHTLSTYGLMNNRTEKEITALIDYFASEGFLTFSGGQYPTVSLTDNVIPVLKGKERILMKQQVRVQSIVKDEGLFQLLREHRKSLAQSEGIPPYIIFSDRTLREMSEICPTNMDELLMVNGVGKVKAQQYGETFLTILNEYAEENKNDIRLKPLSQKEQSEVPSHILSYERFQEGGSINDIAKERELSIITIQGHILRCVEEGMGIEWSSIITSKEIEDLVIKKTKELKTDKLKEIKEALPEEIDYFTIKAVLTKQKTEIS